MKPLLQSGSQRGGAAVASVLLFALGFLPLFGGLGYEQSLAAGIVLPSCAAIATALDVARADGSVRPLALVARGVASGLALAAIGLVLAVLHGFRVAAMSASLAAGFCDLGGGLRGYALTGAMGAVMGGAWGVVAGELTRVSGTRRTRLVCTLLGLAAPVGCVVVSLVRFYTSPMIFAFDPFAGYFSGTLYDTVIDAGMPLLTYRLGSLCTLVAMALVASSAGRDERGRLELRIGADSGARARFALGVCAALVSLAVTVDGAALGHWQTRATIVSGLGGFRAGPRCDVVYPDGLREPQIALLVRDCEEELAHDETVLGTHYDGRITAFFFRDTGEKKHFMGAGDTYIAKPWRREVYLQLHSYPHPVLGHEIAHVVAGTFASGSFHVAGALDGIWPNPGLIEGVAVAASPDEDELTNAEWAHAMLDLGILPPMRYVFSFGFLGEASSKSYTLAGAFVTWVLGKWGPETVRRWYAGESIETLVNQRWDELDAGFRAAISAEPLGEQAKAYAKARFDRPSVFGRTCPHEVDALRREADGCRDALQVDRARALYGDVLVKDAHDWGARLGLGIMELKFGDEPRGKSDLEALSADEAAPRPVRDRTEESLADADLASADPARWAKASARYTALAAATIDEDSGRTMEVKAYAATRGEARVAVLHLLVGSPGRPVDVEEGLARISAWARATGDPVAQYVLGKNLVNHEFWGEAAEHLDAALAGDVPTVRIARELFKQRIVAACALGDTAKAQEVGTRALAAEGPFASSAGRREWLRSFLGRCVK